MSCWRNHTHSIQTIILQFKTVLHTFRLSNNDESIQLTSNFHNSILILRYAMLLKIGCPEKKLALISHLQRYKCRRRISNNVQCLERYFKSTTASEQVMLHLIWLRKFSFWGLQGIQRLLQRCTFLQIVLLADY